MKSNSLWPWSNLPGSSVHGILQARILEWISMPFCQGIFLTQGLNLSLLCLLHWQVGSLPLAPPGYHHLSLLKREIIFYFIYLCQFGWGLTLLQKFPLSSGLNNMEGFPVGAVVKNLSANAGDIRDTGSIPGSGRSFGGGHGNPLQCSFVENRHGQRSLVCCSP